MNSLIPIIWRKEWRDALRDRRTLMTMATLVLMMPVVLYLSLQFMIKKITQDENEAIILLVQRGEQAPSLLTQFRQNGVTIEAVNPKNDDEIAHRLESNKVTALLVLDKDYQTDYLALRPGKMSLWTNSGIDQFAKLRKIKRLLHAYQASAAEWRLIARGVAPALVRPVDLQEYDVAGQGARTGNFLGFMFGMIFFGVFGMSSAMVIDITAGERERRTLELLMAQPVGVWEVTLGKWLAAGLFSFLGLCLQLLLLHVVLLHLPLEEIGMSWQLGVPGLLWLMVSGLPLCLFAAAFIMALAMNTKTFKEAQSTLGIAIMVPMIPVIVVPMLDLGTKSWMYALPATGHGELVKALAKGQALLPLEWLLLLGVPLLLSLLLVTFCAHRLRSERFVMGV
jgi:sodium transport system permease protein